MLASEMVKPKAKQRKIGRGVSLTEATWERVAAMAAANEGTISEVIENAITVYLSVGEDGVVHFVRMGHKGNGWEGGNE